MAIVKVWHLMNHAAAYPGLDEQVGIETYTDWEKMTTLLAAQTPWWEPGTDRLSCGNSRLFAR